MHCLCWLIVDAGVCDSGTGKPGRNWHLKKCPNFFRCCMRCNIFRFPHAHSGQWLGPTKAPSSESMSKIHRRMGEIRPLKVFMKKIVRAVSDLKPHFDKIKKNPCMHLNIFRFPHAHSGHMLAYPSPQSSESMSEIHPRMREIWPSQVSRKNHPELGIRSETTFWKKFIKPLHAFEYIPFPACILRPYVGITVTSSPTEYERYSQQNEGDTTISILTIFSKTERTQIRNQKHENWTRE